MSPTWPQPFLFDSDDDNDDKPAQAPATQPPGGRYCFNLLDSRSSYGHDFFPETFLGPEMDRETQVEVDYLHGEKQGIQDDEVDAEMEWNAVGQLTVAAEFGWDSERAFQPHSGDADDTARNNSSGFESVDLAVYHPIFQYVSANRAFDYTAIARLDIGIPTRTPQSGNDVQLTPYLGQLVRLGDHISIETWTGGQFTIAPDQINPFIYGASFGYRIARQDLSLPATSSVVPLFELDGQTPFSDRGQDALFGIAGFDWNFQPIGDDCQPAIGIGYQFPIDQGARDQLRWGVIAQVFLEF